MHKKCEPFPLTRLKCYRCYRPQSSCMCGFVHQVETKTKFVILMHPKEFKKIKNGTGHLTHLSLSNSELYIGLDFSEHARVNALINDDTNHCVLLYPLKESQVLNDETVSRPDKTTVIFILDATWDCSKKMLRLSKNLHALDTISFTHTRMSQFSIKTQPFPHCLSTIESVLCVLELLDEYQDETIGKQSLQKFLNPFKAMIAYQKNCTAHAHIHALSSAVRYKK